MQLNLNHGLQASKNCNIKYSHTQIIVIGNKRNKANGEKILSDNYIPSTCSLLYNYFLLKLIENKIQGEFSLSPS